MWLPDTKNRLQQWKWFWDYNEKSLYKKHGRGYRKYNTNNEGRRTRAGHNGFRESIWIPGDLIEESLERTTIHSVNGVLLSEGSARIQRTTT